MARSRVKLFEQIRRDWRAGGSSIRELAVRHHVHRRTVRQALASAVPPPQKAYPPRPRPAIGPYAAIIDGWLLADRDVPREQRHKARRIWQRLVAEHGANVAEVTVSPYVTGRRAELGLDTVRSRCLRHAPGAEALCGFPHRASAPGSRTCGTNPPAPPRRPGPPRRSPSGGAPRTRHIYMRIRHQRVVLTCQPLEDPPGGMPLLMRRGQVLPQHLIDPPRHCRPGRRGPHRDLCDPAAPARRSPAAPYDGARHTSAPAPGSAPGCVASRSGSPRTAPLSAPSRPTRPGQTPDTPTIRPDSTDVP